MRGSQRLIAGWAAAALGVYCARGAGLNPDIASDILKFVDGSTLHGQLLELDVDHGLKWKHPAATGPVDFRPDHIDNVRFAHPSVMKLTPTCHVRFADGDDLFGTLTSLDASHVEMTTWFGDKLSVPRDGVQSVSFLSKSYALLYEGPYDAAGWIAPPGNGAGGWHYRDGGFTANGPGLMGRDLGLRGSCTIEFNLTWSLYLGLAINVYSDTPERIDYNSSSYLVQFTRGRVTLQRLRATAVPRNLGMSPPITALEQPGQVQVALQFNKLESSIDLSVDGVLVKQWKDEDGFNVSGGSIVLEQGFPNAMARVSAMRVSSWEGRHEPETSAIVTNTDVLRFINHDKAGGKIQEISDGKVKVDLAPGTLTIPLERLTQIDFASATNSAPEAVNPWTVRAFFPGGGSLSFQLEKWSNNVVQGHSAMFGKLAFQPTGIRELQFNLNRPRRELSDSPVDEFQEADE